MEWDQRRRRKKERGRARCIKKRPPPFTDIYGERKHLSRKWHNSEFYGFIFLLLHLTLPPPSQPPLRPLYLACSVLNRPFSSKYNLLLQPTLFYRGSDKRGGRGKSMSSSSLLLLLFFLNQCFCSRDSFKFQTRGRIRQHTMLIEIEGGGGGGGGEIFFRTSLPPPFFPLSPP